MADNSQVAVVSFSNVTRIENGLERVTAESRERMADTIPGKYQLVDHNIRNISHTHTVRNSDKMNQKIRIFSEFAKTLFWTPPQDGKLLGGNQGVI